MRITATGIGAGIAGVALLLFAALYLGSIRRSRGKPLPFGEWVNALGFGLLPGIALWKIFEMNTFLKAGREIPEPLPGFPWLTAEGRFLPSRIELAAAVLLFTGIVLWMILRKREVPGNGDTLITVACLWCCARMFTETLRAQPLWTLGGTNLIQIAFFLGAMGCLTAWTVRRERAQKSTALTILEWLAVLCCGAAEILNTAGILSVGSGIGDWMVNLGCSVLMAILILTAGADSRKGRG